MAINNINEKQDATLTITNTNSGPIIYGTNNDIDNKIDLDTLGISDIAIKNTDVEPTINKFNNNTDNELDI